MPGVIEYRLDLEGGRPNYKYKGSGTVNVFGGAAWAVVDAYGKMDVVFDDREWVYDLNHNQWQVVAVTGSPNTLIWEVHGNGEIRFYPTEELLKFEQGPSFFTKKYLIIIAYYENLLNQVNAIIESYGQSVPVAFAMGSKMHLHKQRNTEQKINSLMSSLNTIEKNVRNFTKNAKLHRTR